jgi:decaprenylphospho-beta-D-erythro-pentofuranosid-2-ulose 2-reductase
MHRVLVLGGNSDIGNAIASRLVRRRGVEHVILAARDPGSLSERVSSLEGLGAKVEAMQFDLTESDGLPAFVDRVFSDHGDVDVVILAGGVLGDQAAAEAVPDHLEHVLDVNFVGSALVAMSVTQRLRRQGSGTLVILSSIAAVQARRANFAYGASKAGLDAFGRGLADMAAGSGARVLIVRPGFVHSQMTVGVPAAPFAQDPDEVAEAVDAALDSRRTVIHTSPAVGAMARILPILPRGILRRLPR